MTSAPGITSNPTPKPHLEYVDCLRGYAVLMVITVHFTYVFPQLPYIIKRFTMLGWYGVQLFFLMSAFTLLMSWNSERDRSGTVSISNFFIRRYLRIAPAYYLAAALYYLVRPPQYGFDPLQLLSALTFTNGWHPNVMPTVPSSWMVVPGGWSIGVEFAFYAIFPVLASLVTSWSRAAWGVLIAIAVALGCNLATGHLLEHSVAPIPLGNFLYFWLPNQLPVFLLGFALYYVIGGKGKAHPALEAIRPYRYGIIGAAMLSFLAVSFLPLGHYVGDGVKLPETLYIAVPLFAFVMAIASGRTVFVNRAAQEMGKVSFSAYLLHFAVLDLVERFPAVFGTQAAGVRAILYFGAGWVVVVVLVFLVSAAQYRLVELPMMNLARALTRRRKAPLAAA